MRRFSVAEGPEKSLANLSNSLVPLEEAHKLLETKAWQVFDVLSNSPTSLYKCDRYFLNGGFESRRSTWIKPEYKCVIFIDLERDWSTWGQSLVEISENLIPKVIENWKMVLNLNKVETAPSEKLEILVENFRMEILVGINAKHKCDRESLQYIASESDDPSFRIPWKQALGMLHVLSDFTKDEQKKLELFKSFLKPSFCELQSRWLDEQSFVAHQVFRLVRLWVHLNCPFDRKVPQKSLILDIIASDATSQVPQTYHYKISGAFKKFLENLSDHVSYQKFEISNPDRLFGDFNVSKIEDPNPFIMDPANPRNNLLVGATQEETESIEAFLLLCAEKAKETLRNFDVFMRGQMDMGEFFNITKTLDIHGLNKPVHARFETIQCPTFFAELTHFPEGSSKESAKLAEVMACFSALILRQDNMSAQDVINQLAEFVYKYLKIRTSTLFIDRSCPEIYVAVPVNSSSSVSIICGMQK